MSRLLQHEINRCLPAHAWLAWSACPEWVVGQRTDFCKRATQVGTHARQGTCTHRSIPTWLLYVLVLSTEYFVLYPGLHSNIPYLTWTVEFYSLLACTVYVTCTVPRSHRTNECFINTSNERANLKIQLHFYTAMPPKPTFRDMLNNRSSVR